MRQKDIVLLKLLIGVLVLFGLSVSGRQAQAKADLKHTDLRIIYCGGLMGNIEPCG